MTPHMPWEEQKDATIFHRQSHHLWARREVVRLLQDVFKYHIHVLVKEEENLTFLLGSFSVL